MLANRCLADQEQKYVSDLLHEQSLWYSGEWAFTKEKGLLESESMFLNIILGSLLTM